jgi:transcriptional regulator with XRE-family HTH domain
MSIGKRIKEIRNLRGLTQKKLAELSSVSEISIRKYEADSRNPKYEQLLKLAQTLKVDVFKFYEEN